MPDIHMLDAFRAFQDLPHQIAAAQYLDEHLTPEQRKPFQEMFRAAVPLKPEASPSPGRVSNPLAGFPFFSQQDNGAQALRSCQTSTIAMCLRYLKVPGIADDLDYLAMVQRYGDTTSQEAHRQALAKLGVRARFRQDLTAAQVQAEIKAGLPVAGGVLHLSLIHI